MLDDLKYIHERDTADALGIAEKEGQQLLQEFPLDLQPTPGITRVVLAGMGGSALGALIAKVWPGLKVPFEIVRDYEIPAYVDENTLFVASSYSGNTEETLSALAAAEQLESRPGIIIMASGGKLIEIAEAKGYPLLRLPNASQPRYAVLYTLKALVSLFVSVGLLQQSQLDELTAVSGFLDEATKAWIPTVPTDQNRAKQIALDVIGKSAVIYAGPKLAPAAYKWKISFNENAKHIAWTNQFSEFNHNEFMGWTEQPVDKPYTVIDLRSNLEHPRIQKRFEVTERLLSGRRPAPIVVNAEGDSLIKQLLWTIAFGDFVTLYTALANGINPAPVDLIEKFKKSLDD
jgi:glucose/mannose-6-phosphate isomerase